MLIRIQHKLIGLFVLLLIFSFAAKGQIDVTTAFTATQLAETLIGEGIELVSVSSDCYAQAFGKFNCIDCNLGIDSGVVMTTGKAINAEGPNNSGATSFDNDWTDDADLEDLPGVGAIYDACVLEMDIIPNYDTIRFFYVFGSDEYLEWVDYANDAFAFWISGPGIVGDQNMALIPGTVTPVTINNVNNIDYSIYYINNPSAGAALTDDYYIDYDGFTVVLEAFHEVTPCETYHLKLAIGDQLDASFDSGVFLKANSLTTNYIATFDFPGSGFGTGSSYCTTGSDPIPELEPGATSGEWSASPSGLLIDPTTGAIDLSASDPGTYTVTNMVIYGFCEFDTVLATGEITISEPPVSAFSYAGSPYCPIVADPSPILGIGAESGVFSASPAGCVINSVTGIIDVSASSPGTYTITNTIAEADGCPEVFSTTTITIIDSYSITITSEICDDEIYTLPDGTIVSTSGIYITDLITAGGCDSTITTNLTINETYDYTEDEIICEGDFYILPSGSSVSLAGSYMSNLFTDAGCDSLITTNLSVIPTTYSSVSAEICSGDFYFFPDGSSTSSAGVFNTTIVNDAGCDSVITTTISINPIYSIAVSVDICAGTSYVLPDGAIATGAGVYYSSFISADGCDSTIVTTIAESDVIYATVDAEICAGSDYLLPDGMVVNTSGIYISSYTTVMGCDSIITTNLTINENPIINFVPDNIICIENEMYSLIATPTGGIFSGPAISGSVFNPTFVGVGGPYEITYMYTDANGCSDTSVAVVFVDANSAEAFGDTTIVAGQLATIYGIAGGSYAWSPVSFVVCEICPTTTVFPTQTTTFTLTSTNENGCLATDQVLITILPDPGNSYFIPNAFTPNGDQINDQFFAYGPNLIRIKNMRIYDKWGNLVFENESIPASDYFKGWNGTKDGIQLNSGVYAFIMELEFVDEEFEFVKGNVSLLR